MPDAEAAGARVRAWWVLMAGGLGVALGIAAVHAGPEVLLYLARIMVVETSIGAVCGGAWAGSRLVARRWAAEP